ncbi:hypothetical protein ACFDR9_001525 [Janthinobacterium sp. CG_23.3]
MHSYSPDYPAHGGRPQVVLLGAALSLMLHAGLLHYFGAPAARVPVPDNGPGTPYSIIWMAPPKAVEPLPARPPMPAQMASAAPKREAAKRAAGRSARPDHAAAALLPEPISAPVAPGPQQATASSDVGAQPKFDVNAALKSARKLATERAHPGDPPVAQLQDKPINEPQSESRLARNIQRASRADCKDVASGSGLLALLVVPYVVLTDKKDSGCKW